MIHPHFEKDLFYLQDFLMDINNLETFEKSFLFDRLALKAAPCGLKR